MSEKLEAVATSEAPAALGAYSQAVKANGFVFVSGQLGIDPATGELAGESAGEQAAQALKNIKHILDTAGSGIENVVRATIYMKNVEDFHEVDDVYAKVFIGSVKPARVAFGGNAIAVDTHVFRVSARIGLANGKTPTETEKILMKKIPEEMWSRLHHALIYHGRRVCVARSPKCDECVIRELCEKKGVKDRKRYDSR